MQSIHLFGDNSKPEIIENIIKKNFGPGIVVDIANQAIIKRNIIEYN
jgi:hypothetical protein